MTGIKRVVVSSSSVLNHYLEGGEDGGDFGKEEAFPRPTTFYAATKQAVENLGLNYAKWCGIEFAGLRYGAVFGPWSGTGGGGPSNVVREAMRSALAGREAILPPGAMEWVYSKDAARGTVMALDAEDLGRRVFDITMGSLTTPNEMASALQAAVPDAKEVRQTSRFAVPASGGVAGVHVADVFRRLGIMDQLTPKLKLTCGQRNAEFVAKGEADIAVQLTNEIRIVPGIEFIPFPPEFGRTFIFSAALGSNAKDLDAAKAILRFLAGPEAVAVVEAKGMDRVHPGRGRNVRFGQQQTNLTSDPVHLKKLTRAT